MSKKGKRNGGQKAKKSEKTKRSMGAGFDCLTGKRPPKSKYQHKLVARGSVVAKPGQLRLPEKSYDRAPPPMEPQRNLMKPRRASLLDAPMRRGTDDAWDRLMRQDW